jgi:hypothetical protein
MATSKTKTKQQQRSKIIIGGTGPVPVMNFSHGEPKYLGLETIVTLVIETPTHRYSIDRMYYYNDYQERKGTGRWPRYSIKEIWGAAYNSDTGRCHGTPNTAPSVNHMCIVVWGDNTRTAMPIEIEELSKEERVVHQQTLNRAGASEEYRKFAGAVKKINNIEARFVSLEDNLKSASKQQQELIPLLKSSQDRQIHPKKKKWENVWACYLRQSCDLSEGAKWLEVANIVVKSAIVESNKKDKGDRLSDYLDPAQLERCIENLKTGSLVKIKQAMADSLRVTINRHVPKDEREAAKQKKQP